MVVYEIIGRCGLLQNAVSVKVGNLCPLVIACIHVVQALHQGLVIPNSTLLYHVSLWYLGAETDDHRNPKSDDRDQLVGD